MVVDGSKTINSITINGSSSVVLSGNNTTATITLNCAACISLIEIGSTLTITGTTATNKCELTLASSAIFNINGTLNLGTSTQTAGQRLLPTLGTTTTVNGTINVVGSSASIVGSSAANYIVNGIQDFKRNGGIFPLATYATTARNIVSGQTTSQVSYTSSQTTTWGNIEINASGNTLTATNNLFSGNAICENFKVINDGTGNVAMSGSSTARILTVNGNLEISTGTILSINVSTTISSTASGIIVLGNTIIDGALTETGLNTASFITLAGTTPQSISINGAISNDVTLNINGSGIKTALTDILLPNSANAKLVFTNGNLDMMTNNKLLFIQNPASNACITGTSTSHVIGKMKRNTNLIASYHFPISINGTDIPKCLITTNAAAVSDFTVEFLGVNANKTMGLSSGIIDQVANYVWDIQRASGGPTAQVSLGYAGYALNSLANPSTAKVVHWSGSLWEDKGGFADVVPAGINAISSNIGCNDFSPYSIGGILGILPISISNFKGSKISGSHYLNWKVNCTTSPSISIILERSSDSKSFKAIDEQTATSVRCLQAFDYTDASPLAGINYYRLKVVDQAGVVNYSSIVALLNKEKGFEVISIAPNPVKNNATLTLTSAKAAKLQIKVVDFAGKMLSAQKVSVIAGNNLLPFNFANLAAGTYNILAVNVDGETKTIRFVKY